MPMKIVCTRTPAVQCHYCRRKSEILCDYPVKSHKSGTCDRPCCRLHAKCVGLNLDYCWTHAGLKEDKS